MITLKTYIEKQFKGAKVKVEGEPSYRLVSVDGHFLCAGDEAFCKRYARLKPWCKGTRPQYDKYL